jgi:hypothetical protein
MDLTAGLSLSSSVWGDLSVSVIVSFPFCDNELLRCKQDCSIRGLFALLGRVGTRNQSDSGTHCDQRKEVTGEWGFWLRMVEVREL